MTKSSAVFAVLLMLAAGSAFAADPAKMSVTVRETQVRATANYLGKPLGVLSYGDRVTVLDQPADSSKDWLKVSFPGKKLQGWVNASALIRKEIILNAGTEEAKKAASSGDVVLAGKGFNADVEKEYNKDGKLDKAEKAKISAEDKAKMEKAGLAPKKKQAHTETK